MNAAAGGSGRDLAATNEGLLSHIVVTLQRLDITGASPAQLLSHIVVTLQRLNITGAPPA